MCYAIYAAVILLFVLFTDQLLAPLALSTQIDGQQWLTLALGWEIAAHIWPLLLLSAALASLLTFLISRRFSARRRNVSEQD